MSEELLIRHCSPTLAALKPGNLFSCNTNDMDSVQQIVEAWNLLLNDKGVQVEVLYKTANRVLIYVYRPALLERILGKREAKALLVGYGYPLDMEGESITHLKYRLEDEKHFPHEIGVFLGYPIDDVRLFIENQGCNGKYDGIWKVYGNEQKAKQRFAQYKKCTEVFLQMYAKGKTLDTLTVRKAS
ncbi:MAG: DUF3793 family protein [Sphaerochaeta sp.]|nr:DUF3793 family protein [Sphaerochaeta sp.]